MASRSRVLVLGVVVAILAVAAAASLLRVRMRCAGFAGPAVTTAELPARPAPSNRLRLSTWNLRNFPLDERPQHSDLGFSRRTNICDLEAALGGLQADVLGLAEIVDARRFPPILRRAAGSRRFDVLLSAQGGAHGQRLGVAWDSRRLQRVGQPVEIAALLVEDGLRPGFAVQLASRRPGGVDLTVVQVHLKAAPQGFETRRRQYLELARWVEDWVARVGDEDVVVMGDLNTTGPVGGDVYDELEVADALLGMAGLRRLDNPAGCSEYWEGTGERDGIQQPSLLDHVYVRSLEELEPSVPLEVWLHCRRAGCRELVSRPGAEDGTFWDVSDHCPLTFEVVDVDLDP